jgi:hypothetical protein
MKVNLTIDIEYLNIFIKTQKFRKIYKGINE